MEWVKTYTINDVTNIQVFVFLALQLQTTKCSTYTKKFLFSFISFHNLYISQSIITNSVL